MYLEALLLVWSYFLRIWFYFWNLLAWYA